VLGWIDGRSSSVETAICRGYRIGTRVDDDTGQCVRCSSAPMRLLGCERRGCERRQVEGVTPLSWPTFGTLLPSSLRADQSSPPNSNLGNQAVTVLPRSLAIGHRTAEKRGPSRWCTRNEWLEGRHRSSDTVFASGCGPLAPPISSNSAPHGIAFSC
jgi:hypothetical protein